jgi:phosphoribosylamine--glycine ligase
MRVLIVGGGGREHALAWKFKRDDPSVELIATPGNPGIAEIAECVDISPTDLPALQKLAKDRSVDLTVVGPEAPLALGIVNQFRATGLEIFGPTKEAAEIETSKAFAKQLMFEANVPTARAEMHTERNAAKAAARRFRAPVVIKASGLASGKGVIVCATLEEAYAAIDDMLSSNRFGSAGHEVLVEEFMEGEEISVFALTDGSRFVLLPPLQDHKRLLDNDQGPNTGGMGAYLPVTLDASHDEMHAIVDGVLRALHDAGRPFTGLLYAGLMRTREGLKVVEFNCRFGDPETQALMPVLEMQPSLLNVMHAIARGHAMPATSARTRLACVTTVLAAENYPEKPRTGDAISLPQTGDNVTIFHAGTARAANGTLVTAGGRVVAVSATGQTMRDAQRESSEVADRVNFRGKQRRTDIGWREIARAARD